MNKGLPPRNQELLKQEEQEELKHFAMMSWKKNVENIPSTPSTLHPNVLHGNRAHQNQSNFFSIALNFLHPTEVSRLPPLLKHVSHTNFKSRSIPRGAGSK